VGAWVTVAPGRTPKTSMNGELATLELLSPDAIDIWGTVVLMGPSCAW
jgi:hypothetical protein